MTTELRSATDAARLLEWIGSSESRSDEVTRAPIAALSAILDRDDPAPRVGDSLPPLWHWLYFLPITRHSEIDHDGHPKRGGFLPPVPLSRRMWAGGRVQFRRPLRVGEAIARVSHVVDVSHKTGRSGPLTLVVVRHEISSAGTLALIEEQDLLYLAAPHESGAASTPRRAAAAAADPAWERRIRPDATLLFRFSALTFNGHRIHYDRQYAQTVEGYPALVVHAPLAALLLLDAMRRHMPNHNVAAFSFRAMKPLLDCAPFDVCGKPEADGSTVRLWIRDAAGELATDATATLA